MTDERLEAIKARADECKQELDALKAMVHEYLEDGRYTAEQDERTCANCGYPYIRKERRSILSPYTQEHSPNCLYRKLRIASGLEPAPEVRP